MTESTDIFSAADAERGDLAADIAATEALALDEDEFWDLIDVLDGVADEESTEELSDRLAEESDDRIIGFEAALTIALYALDTRASYDWYAEHDPDAEELGVSDDVFLYARCATVAAGRAVWERAVAEGTLPSNEEDPGAAEFLLVVASDAFGDEWDQDVVPLSYETGTNTVGWSDEA